MYKISRYWNRVAYLIISFGRVLIWDQTGNNRNILTVREFASYYSKGIMCGSKRSH